MTARLITYILCGMRHPTTGLSEDDLSRLTGSSSSTASCDSSSSSSSSSSSPANTPAHKEGADECAHTHTGLTSPDKTTNNTLALVTNTLKQTNNNIINITNNNNNNNNKSSTNTTTSSRFSSTYLPELINPLEWQKSRKRKERLDSTSSVTQDRKLQRSNSEELLTQDQQAPSVSSADAINEGSNALKAIKSADAIRRVSSEDFKKTASYAVYEQELREAAECRTADLKQRQLQQQPQQFQQQQHQQRVVDENDGSLANRQCQQQLQNQQVQQQPEEPTSTPVYRDSWVTGPTKDMTRRSRYETSPARSQRFSPIRTNCANGGSKHRDSDDSECEHERRRSSERSCKSRQPPGRKVGVVKKSIANGSAGGNGSGSSAAAKYLASSKRSDDNSAYKYDLSALKYERRGFISKKGTTTNSTSEKTTNDHNDNNLIDFHQQPQTQTQPQLQSQSQSQPQSQAPTPMPAQMQLTTVSAADNNDAKATESVAVKRTSANSNAYSSVPLTAAQEALPWGRSVPEDATPMLSRRYAPVRHHPADHLDTAAKLSKVMPYPQQFHKQFAAQRFHDDMDCMDSLSTFRAFTSRDVMEQVIPAMMSFQSPEERLKQVNKRLTALKKKLVQLEEAYEMRVGYRPSQAERMNDKYMKNILADLNKLRKERQVLKTDPMGALGLKVSGGMNAAEKLDKMKTTLQEIEQNLTDKREDANRSESLDELNADQLVQEKTAVQHGLLYFESLYGRPAIKEERDAARPLYDRYRQLKRMVLRSVMQSGSAVAGAPELPTILENEAMVFEFTPQQLSSANSTASNSPSDSAAPNASSDDSTTTTTGVAAEPTSAAGTQTSTSSAGENISAFNIEQLWEHLEKTREEKKLLKRTIREYETIFEEQNGRKMLKNDRKTIEETYAQYKEKKAKTRLLQELIKKQKRTFA